MNSKELEALEKQLKKVRDAAESAEMIEEVDKALHMLPRYKAIDTFLEQLRVALLESYIYTIDYENEYNKYPGIDGVMEKRIKNQKTITIRINGGA